MSKMARQIVADLLVLLTHSTAVYGTPYYPPTMDSEALACLKSMW